MLKNDSGTPEFVLDGKYYSLPFPLHQLIRNGWDSVPTWGGNGSKSINEIPLSEGEYADIQISASYGQIHLIVTQLNQNGSDIKDATVVGVYYGVIYDIQSDRYSDLFSGKSHPQLVGSYEAVLEEKL